MKNTFSKYKSMMAMNCVSYMKTTPRFQVKVAEKEREEKAKT